MSQHHRSRDSGVFSYLTMLYRTLPMRSQSFTQDKSQRMMQSEQLSLFCTSTSDFIFDLMLGQFRKSPQRACHSMKTIETASTGAFTPQSTCTKRRSPTCMRWHLSAASESTHSASSSCLVNRVLTRISKNRPGKNSLPAWLRSYFMDGASSWRRRILSCPSTLDTSLIIAPRHS